MGALDHADAKTRQFEQRLALHLVDFPERSEPGRLQSLAGPVHFPQVDHGDLLPFDGSAEPSPICICHIGLIAGPAPIGQPPYKNRSIANGLMSIAVASPVIACASNSPVAGPSVKP